MSEIPAELWGIIAEFLAWDDGIHTLPSLNRANREIHEGTLPVLYETVWLEDEAAFTRCIGEKNLPGFKYTKYVPRPTTKTFANQLRQIPLRKRPHHPPPPHAPTLSIPPQSHHSNLNIHRPLPETRHARTHPPGSNRPPIPAPAPTYPVFATQYHALQTHHFGFREEGVYARDVRSGRRDEFLWWVCVARGGTVGTAGELDGA